MEDTIKAYLAGIIDGEGTVTLQRRNKVAKFRHPTVSVSNTSYELICFLKEQVGGVVSKHKTYKAHHKPSWVWSLRYVSAISFLREIEPFLLLPEKRHRALLILEVYPTVTMRNGKYTPDQEKQKLAFEHEFFHPSAAIEVL